MTPRFLLIPVLLVFLATMAGTGLAQSGPDTECDQILAATDHAYDAGDFGGVARLGATVFQRCPIADRDWARLSSRFAAALSHAGHKEEALGVLGRCITRQSRAAACYWGKVEILRRLGRRDEAEQTSLAAQKLGLSPDEAAPQRQAKAGQFQQERSDQSASQSSPAAVGAEASKGRDGAVKAGSGFFINGRGNVVTNAHVVSGCDHVETIDKIPLRIVGVDRSLDLAVLLASRASSETASLRLTPPLRVGEDVLAFGFPLPGLLSSEGNVTVGILSATRGVADDPHILQITAPVQNGNSGGPLVDAAGNLIGVIVAKLDAANVLRQTGDLPQNVNFAIKATELATFLDRLAIPYAQGTLSAHKNSADLAEAAKKFSVQIICSGG